jgi:hypothetical protein
MRAPKHEARKCVQRPAPNRLAVRNGNPAGIQERSGAGRCRRELGGVLRCRGTVKWGS